MKCKLLIACICLSVLAACQSTENSAEKSPGNSIEKSAKNISPEPIVAQQVKIAFLADIHFHNVYGKLQDNVYQGLKTATPTGDKPALIRSMGAQLRSTRLFNETYYVLLATLDDLVARGVTLVALPGDFSDDGQPFHLKGLADILHHYQDEYGMRFFAIPGNHDPVKPFTVASGKKDFLGEGGQEVSIYSLDDKRCAQGETEGLVCSNDLQKWGYKEVVKSMADFGFFPRSQDLYFETPFAKANQQNYAFKERYFTWCEATNTDNCVAMPDTSYLVEPIDGLWLLAIDANVYRPNNAEHLTQDGNDYQGSSSAGYNALLQYKPELLSWIRDVVIRAKKQNKRLVAFSHFPMTDFYDMAQSEMETLFGKGKQQMARMPLLNTAKVLANTGLQLHVGGHMHINDTGSVVGENNKVLFNIQAPSLAAYRPGYKLFTLQTGNEAEVVDVETVVLDQVPRFDELFSHYRTEHNYLTKQKSSLIWNKQVLNAASYGELTDYHLQELIRLRYLPKEWPKELVDYISQHSFSELFQSLAKQCDVFDENQAVKYAQNLMTADTFELFNDFYRLRNADSVALVDDNRKAFYLWMNTQLQACHFEQNSLEQNNTEQKFALMMSIVAKFVKAQPSDHVRLHLLSGEIEAVDEGG